MAYRWAIVLISLSCGCSHSEVPAGPPDAGDDAAVRDDGPALPVDDGRRFLSGTRLRVRWREAGGARQFAGWRDTAMNVDCRFHLAEDGEFRCLPGVVVPYSLYSDAGCTKPVVDDDWCNATGYVQALPIYTCSGRRPEKSTVLQIQNQPYAGDPWGSDGRTCVNLGASPAKAWQARRIPPDQFVKATRRSLTTGGLLVGAFDGEDGSRQRTWEQAGSATNVAKRASCEILLDVNDVRGQHRCVPTPVERQREGLFGDRGCQEPVTVTLCPDVQSVITHDDYVDCHHTLRAMGDPVDATELYAAAEFGACFDRGQAFPELVWSVGTPLPPDELPRVVPALVGSGDVQIVELQSATGDPLAASGDFHIASLGADCTPLPVPGHGVRCVPTDAQLMFGLYYLDAACTESVTFVDPCRPHPFAVDFDEGKACPAPVLSVHKMGPAQDAVALYEQAGPGQPCTPSKPPPRNSKVAPIMTIDPETLPLVTETTE